MRTPATRALDAAGLDYRITRYETRESGGGYGDHVVSTLGLDPDTVGKTLVAVLDDDRCVVAVVPVNRSLDLKALARTAGAKRARLADAATAERLTGSVVGGIAPVGHRRRLDVYVDALLARHDEVHVSGGRRGLEVSLRMRDLVAIADATVAEVSA